MRTLCRLLSCLAVSLNTARAAVYNVIDLGSLADSSTAGRVNASAGGRPTTVAVPGGIVAHPFLYSGGVMHDLGSIPVT